MNFTQLELGAGFGNSILAVLALKTIKITADSAKKKAFLTGALYLESDTGTH